MGRPVAKFRKCIRLVKEPLLIRDQSWIEDFTQLECKRKGKIMNRRTFLFNGVLATVGIATLPAAPALAKLSEVVRDRNEDIPASKATEAEAIDDILDYVGFWDEDLPGHNFKELLLKRLLQEKNGLTDSEMSRLNWKQVTSGKMVGVEDDWIQHAVGISGS